MLWAASPLPAAAAASNLPTPPVVSGSSAAVVDAATGAVLWSDHGSTRLAMASTTKMMTALVALGLTHNRTDIPMVVPPQVSQTYGQTLDLRPGDRYTFMQLLEGMLLFSANDAAMTIAVDTAGSESAFVQLMNQRARALGLRNTHFANPDGLDNPDHYSSAVDLALLGVAAQRNPVIRSVVQMRSAVIPWPQQNTTRVVGNIDSLLLMYPGATGIKTGYTSEAMNVVVGSATHGSASVVGVVMGEPAADVWTDVTNVLDYGFALEAAGQDGSGTADPSSIHATLAPAFGPAVVPASGIQPSVRATPAPAPSAVHLLPWLLGGLLALLAVAGIGRRGRRRGLRRRRRRPAGRLVPSDRRGVGTGPAARPRGVWP